jgi:hypothetical protein
LDNWAKIEFLFLYKLRVQKHDLRKLEFWDIEETLDLWKEQMDKEKEEHDKQQKNYSKQQSTPSMKPTSYKAPKAPKPSTNFGGFNVPKMNIPKM